VKEYNMNIKIRIILGATVLALSAQPLTSLAQDEESSDKKDEKKKAAVPVEIQNVATIGAYYLDDDSYRFGKYSGLTDKGGYALFDFRLEKRPDPKSSDITRWRLQGWRMGLDSRRLEFDYSEQGSQNFSVDYREIPNYRFSDGQTPYREQAPGLWNLAPGWEVAPGSSNTRGFLTLEESLVDLRVDTKRRRVDLAYDRKLGSNWNLDIEYKHETKKGERTLGSIFGYSGSNPRAVILPAPVDWTTDIIEAMFHYGTARAQFGIGFYASFFGNDESTLTFQNAYGNLSAWDSSVEYPGSQGRFALEPDNSYLQFKAYGAMNFSRSTRLTADFSSGKMEQNERLLPYTVNPELDVHTPVPLTRLDGKVNTMMLNLRLTSQLARRLGLRVNYHYDDRDNKTPRAAYPYIGADSQDQRDEEDGRINLPYSYTRQKTDAVLTFRLPQATRLRAGIEYSDYSRDYQEVEDSDEFAWLAGVSLRGWSMGALSFNYRNSDRDVSDYVGNTPYIESHIPGTVDEDDWENHPLLRKYFLTDRRREQYRLRADLFPFPELNLGFSSSYNKDDYGAGYFGLNEAKIKTWTVDGGWYPRENVALTGFYTNENYDASQSARSFRNTSSAEDPDNDWFADTEDRVDTYNIALKFTDIGADKGWVGAEFGLDFTYSDTSSNIDVVSLDVDTEPLPELVTRMKTFSIWGAIAIGDRSSIRLTAENARLTSRDWGLDGVVPDTLSSVLLLGQSAANFDLWLISGSWSYRF
jgi:MtrB/PioB family decaheme-associated outer membrane protein